MLNQVLAAVLPLLLWGAVSGVLNLMLTRKSQIEAWITANPRLAAWSKFLRSVGFDPWAAHAWLTLLVKKRLPEAQRSDSPVARLEQRKADAKALGSDRDPPGDSPAVGAAPISIRPPGGMDAEFRVYLPGIFACLPLALFGVVALLVMSCSPAAQQFADPCSRVSLATVTAGCEVRIKAECEPGDTECPIYKECTRAVAAWKGCQ